jgi:hypothetical protein
MPIDGKHAHFIQRYFHDTANKVQNRIQAVNQRQLNMKIRVDITQELISMLDANNELVKVFKMARDKYTSGEISNLQIRLHYRRDVRAR